MIESGQKNITRKKIIGIFLIILVVFSSGVASFVVIFLFNNPHNSSPIICVFRSQWDTTKTSPGSSNDHQVRLPLISEGKYEFTVDWGDLTSYNIST